MIFAAGMAAMGVGLWRVAPWIALVALGLVGMAVGLGGSRNAPDESERES